MSRSQEGTFYAGAFGYPVEIHLGANLVGVTGVLLNLTRPDQTTFQRQLGQGSIQDSGRGVVVYIPIEGDLSIRGKYCFVLTVATGSTRRLIARGTFTIC